MTRREHDLVRHIVAAKPRTRVRPREFFLSWSGVPTLAYHGFSPTLLSIKRELEETIPGLKPENPGARWPKTTLGALRDGRTLSLDEARTLRRICDELQPLVDAEPSSLEIAALSFVVFQCRSLERRLLTQPLELRADGAAAIDHEPPADHLEQVAETMRQFSSVRLAEYLEDLQKPGNHESHYRSTHVEATLVFDLGDEQPRAIDRFIAEVDRELPGAYVWFEPASRHMTVRGLV